MSAEDHVVAVLLKNSPQRWLKLPPLYDLFYIFQGFLTPALFCWVLKGYSSLLGQSEDGMPTTAGGESALGWPNSGRGMLSFLSLEQEFSGNKFLFSQKVRYNMKNSMVAIVSC